MSFVEFLMEYYIYILIVLILMIITIIGFLADKREKKKKKNKGNININDNVNNQSAQSMTNIAPTPLQPQNLDVNMGNTNTMMNNNGNLNNFGMANGINTQNNVMEQPLIKEEIPQNSNNIVNNNDVNGLGYKPLDEQKPKIAPRPVEMPNKNVIENVNSNNVSSTNIPFQSSPVEKPMANANFNQQVNSIPTVSSTINATNNTASQVNPIQTGTQSVMETPVVNNWNVTPNSVVNPTVSSSPNIVTMQTSNPLSSTNISTETPVVNSWKVTPIPTVNSATVSNLDKQIQTSTPVSNVNNNASAPMQSNINATFGSIAANVNQSSPMMQQSASQVTQMPQNSGMNFVYAQDAVVNKENQVDNNQDLWKL